MTELVECESAQDICGCRVYKTKYEAVRSPRRTTHSYMALATPVPGSWNGQGLECNQAACHKLLKEKAAPKEILRFECDVCKNER